MMDIQSIDKYVNIRLHLGLFCILATALSAAIRNDVLLNECF